MPDPTLDLDYPDAWVPPPTTRWCLVGEPGRDGGRLYVLSESGQAGDPEVGVAEPSRGNYLSADPADHPAEWLSPHGIGTTTTLGDGLAGFAWYLTMESDQRDRDRAAARRRPR